MHYDSFDSGVDLQLVNVRSYLESKYGSGVNLCGKCIRASNIILLRLKTMGYKNCRTVEGWCIYDDASNCSNRGYDEHTWVEVCHNSVKYYIDITADQFNSYMDEEYPAIICCKSLPHGMSYDKPKD